MPQIFPLSFARRYPVRALTPWPVYTPVRPVVTATRFRPYTTKAVPIEVLPTPKPLCRRYHIYDYRTTFIGPFPVVIEGGGRFCYMTEAQAAFHIQHSHVCGLLPWFALPLSRRKIIEQLTGGRAGNFAAGVVVSSPAFGNPAITIN